MRIADKKRVAEILKHARHEDKEVGLEVARIYKERTEQGKRDVQTRERLQDKLVEYAARFEGEYKVKIVPVDIFWMNSEKYIRGCAIINVKGAVLTYTVDQSGEKLGLKADLRVPKDLNSLKELLCHVGLWVK